jgi:endonuclease YncB( thermonuclease family)
MTMRRAGALTVGGAVLAVLLGGCTLPNEAASDTTTGPSTSPAIPAPDSPTSADAITPTPTSPAVAQPAPSASEAQPSNATTGQVTDVIDGDTIDVNGTRIRIVGIDTPERGECGYREATNAMSGFVSGKAVRLVAPGGGTDNADRYGRLLRYVEVGSRDVGLAMIERGFAIARYDSRDGYAAHPREGWYVAADAASAKAPCSTGTTSAPTSKAAAPAPAAGAGSRARCDASYPGVCIPPAPPDLDCGDITARRFKVVGTDPHRFDGDRDGVGCDSG